MKYPRAWGMLSGVAVSILVIALGWDAAFPGLLVSTGVMFRGL